MKSRDAFPWLHLAANIMSSHFSANQYETAFSPQRLQNYQIPAQHKERPSLRKGCTTIVSNDRGHLNSHIRRSSTSPWGCFIGTWQRERKPIHLHTTTKLMAHLSQIQGGSRASSAKSHGSKEEGEGEKEKRPLSGSARVTPAGQPSDKEASTKDEPAARSPVPSQQEGSKPPTPAPHSAASSQQQGSKPPTPAGSSRPSTTASKPGTGSARGSEVLSPTGSARVMSAQLGSRGASPAQSSRSQTPVRAQSASVRSGSSNASLPPSSARSQTASPLPPPSGVPSRPESRMAASGTQSPLVFQPQTGSKPNSRAGSAATPTIAHENQEQQNTSTSQQDKHGTDTPV